MQGTRALSLDQKDTLEEEVAIHSSILAEKIPQAGEPGKLCPWGPRVGQLSTHTGIKLPDESARCSAVSRSLLEYTGSSVPGILQARILEWVAISCSRASS